MSRPLVATALLAATLAGVVRSQDARPAPAFDEIIRMRVVYTLPGMDRVSARRNRVYRAIGTTELTMDAYMPAALGQEERRPAVLFVHGGPIAPAMAPKDWGVYVSYGELAAASGLVGITFNHRFYGAKEAKDADSDIAALVEHVRTNADSLLVDRDRLAVWAFSGGGLFLSRFLQERPAYLRALVSYYALLDNRVPPPGVPNTLTDEERRALSPAAHLAVGTRPVPPMLIARAGRDNPHFNATVDTFVKEALAEGVALELLNHPAGRHGFDILDNDARTREILARTFDFLKEHLD
jgi:dienelactone hydrolase